MTGTAAVNNHNQQDKKNCLLVRYVLLSVYAYLVAVCVDVLLS